MTDDIRLEQLLRDTLRSAAPSHAPASLRLATLSATSHTRQRPRWLAVVRARPLSLEAELAAGSPALRLALIVALLAALVAGALGAGAFVNLLLHAPDARPLFSASGSMAIARSWHTATLLRDGRVLVVGGEDIPNESLASAEVWDPATGRFSITGSMTTPRDSATATLLQDGRVLVVGGWQYPSGANWGAEVWDPATGRFTPAGTLASPRFAHTATLLADGRVLVIGGYSDYLGNVLSDSAEVWDPATNAFSAAGTLAAGSSGHSATLLQDGRVLVIGGLRVSPSGAGSHVVGQDGYHFVKTASAEIWDPTTRTFTVTGSLVTARTGHTATLLSDDSVLVAGGQTQSDDTDTVEVWNPASSSFSVAGTLLAARSGSTALLLPDGRMLVIGGDEAGSVEIRDPVTGSFSWLGVLATPRRDGTATLLADGRVLVVGGSGPAGALASSELIAP